MARYIVKIEDSVYKYIHKLGTEQEGYFRRRFFKLENNKEGYRMIERTSKGTELWELRCCSHRVYYTVENQFVVIDHIEYDGNIDILKAGNKNTQTHDINYMKGRLT
jgi:mRNA-degrading endonuclease RelE of RelBE toxin-antitoxin system